MKTTWISAAAAALTIGVAGVAHAQEDGGMGTFGTTPAATDTTTYRPEGRSIGIGAGYSVPSGSVGPNTGSVRIRLPSALTIEPIVGVGISSASGKSGTAKTSESDVDLFGGANIRKPMMSRRKVDLVGILGAGLDISSSSSKDATGDKVTATGVAISGRWGAGVEYWAKEHIAISADATNPAISINSTSGKSAGVKTSNTAFFVGAIWDPTVRVMIHIFQ